MTELKTEHTHMTRRPHRIRTSYKGQHTQLPNLIQSTYCSKRGGGGGGGSGAEGGGGVSGWLWLWLEMEHCTTAKRLTVVK